MQLDHTENYKNKSERKREMSKKKEKDVKKKFAEAMKKSQQRTGMKLLKVKVK